MVLQRGLEETTDPVMFDNAVLPGLVRLVLLPLKRYGLQLAVVEEGAMEESTEGLLTRTRKAIMMEPADEADINTELTTKVTEFIVGQISGAIQTAKFSAEGSNIHSAAAVSKRRGAESVLVLTSNRNAQKHIAERAGAMARSSVAKLLQNDDGSIATDEDSKSHGLSGMDCGSVPVLVDDAKRTMFEEQRRKVEELKSKIQEGESEKVKWLRSVASGLEAERLTVQEQIAELRMTLQKLESEEEELACKISSTEDDIAQEEMKESAEAKLLQEELLNANEAAKYGTLVGGLSKTMKTYAETVQTAALKKVKMDEASMTAAEVASGNMALYLQELSKYFSAESECLAELKSRLQSHSSKVTSLKLEMEQMSGLGLTTTMGQIEETISSSEQTIENDSSRLVALMNDSASMVDELVSRLEAFRQASKASYELEPLNINILLDIKAFVDDAGIAGGERLKMYIPQSRASSPVVKTDFTDTTVSSLATPSHEDQATAEALPKLTWARNATNGSSSSRETLSLLDIQREELESKK